MTDQHKSEDRKTENEEIACAEFQSHLPEFFAGSDNALTADPAMQDHLKTCSNCAALVRDLQYIAEQARLLLEPTHDHDPSDNVWNKIQSKLKEESGS